MRAIDFQNWPDKPERPRLYSHACAALDRLKATAHMQIRDRYRWCAAWPAPAAPLQSAARNWLRFARQSRAVAPGFFFGVAARFAMPEPGRRTRPTAATCLL